MTSATAGTRATFISTGVCPAALPGAGAAMGGAGEVGEGLGNPSSV